MGKVIVGQQRVIEELLIAIFARGHCLMQGVPGLAKTLLISTLAQTMDLSFRRIQFTPDLMPSDIVGTEILQEDPETGRRKFEFQPGPIFAHLVLADEINRTPPKTQAALLQGMQERQVSIGSRTLDLPDPFFVLATQNPIEQEGTYPLPEAQLDRFMFMVNVNYPNREEELDVLKRTTGADMPQVNRILSAGQINELQSIVRRVPVGEQVFNFALDIIRATRPNEPAASDFVRHWLSWGAGPRAGQYMILAAKALRPDARAIARHDPGHRIDRCPVLAASDCSEFQRRGRRRDRRADHRQDSGDDPARRWRSTSVTIDY